MKETTVHLSDEEYAWVKGKGNNYLRHLIQTLMLLGDLFHHQGSAHRYPEED